jgi:hypothetical protein
MLDKDPLPTAARRRRLLTVAGLTLVTGVSVAVLVGTLGNQASLAAQEPRAMDAVIQTGPTTVIPPADDLQQHPDQPPRDGFAADPSTDEGGVGAGASVFDDWVPAVANLDPSLRDALRQAATAAGADGVTFTVNSGWRSPEYQNELLEAAIAQYGSAKEAARWVATPKTSPHVHGEAVDLGLDASIWLSSNGAAFGLCQIYANERWHYELRPAAIDQDCPAMYTDPTYDPRMQQ